MSLNNRISIRDTYNARAVVELNPTNSNSGRSENTGDSISFEVARQEKQSTSLTQEGVRVVSERVISESRNFRFTGFLMPAADIV